MYNTMQHCEKASPCSGTVYLLMTRDVKTHINLKRILYGAGKDYVWLVFLVMYKHNQFFNPIS